jgi:hypothetical protein
MLSPIILFDLSFDAESKNIDSAASFVAALSQN